MRGRTAGVAARRLSLRQLLVEEQGTEIVEFALSLPILVTISFGALELLLLLSCYVGATYGSRAAVRYAATHGAASITPCTSANLTSIVKSYIVGLPDGQVNVTSTWTPNNAVGSGITVQVSLSYPRGIPFTKLNAMSASTVARGTILQ